MSAIQPPPVETMSPAARENNDAAIERLRASTPRRTRTASTLALLGFVGATAVAGAIGALVHRRTGTKIWYRTLRKPSYTPPSALFPFVWTGLYTAAALSGWRVWRSPPSEARTAALALWVGQLALNAAWTPLFFGAHRPRLALADLAGNTATLGAYALAAGRVDRPAAALVAPYLGWLGYAGAMNAGLIQKNAWRL